MFWLVLMVRNITQKREMTDFYNQRDLWACRQIFEGKKILNQKYFRSLHLILIWCRQPTGGQIVWCWGWWGRMRHYLRLTWRSCPCLISEILSFDLQSPFGSKKYMNFEFELHLHCLLYWIWVVAPITNYTVSTLQPLPTNYKLLI